LELSDSSDLSNYAKNYVDTKIIFFVVRIDAEQSGFLKMQFVANGM
jgi:hypothetical protein